MYVYMVSVIHFVCQIVIYIVIQSVNENNKVFLEKTHSLQLNLVSETCVS